jgi:hypothetical protein
LITLVLLFRIYASRSLGKRFVLLLMEYQFI